MFNFELSQQRIRIEYAIGMLKSWWLFLRGLCILIKDEDLMAHAKLWIQACIVLHKYLVDLSDDSTWVMLGDDVTGAEEEYSESFNP